MTLPKSNGRSSVREPINQSFRDTCTSTRCSHQLDENRSETSPTRGRQHYYERLKHFAKRLNLVLQQTMWPPTLLRSLRPFSELDHYRNHLVVNLVNTRPPSKSHGLANVVISRPPFKYTIPGCLLGHLTKLGTPK